MQHKIFCVREFIKTESATAAERAFRLRFNIQPPTRKSICRCNHQFEQTGCLCIKAKAPADHVYQRRTWDEFKRVLSVAHASQPVERAENLEYRKQLSGVCWGAVYCSSHKDLRSECQSFWITLYSVAWVTSKATALGQLCSCYSWGSECARYRFPQRWCSHWRPCLFCWEARPFILRHFEEAYHFRIRHQGFVYY